ncbi:MAG: hypothetical protein HY747_06520 [Elusimicrobia bacterium]|nr:hypothetical protein [Elusimicrobiota bacterium]
MVSKKLLEPLSRFIGVCRDKSLDYMLMGGFAVQFWTRGRTTRDMDVTVLLGLMDPKEFENLMQGAGFKRRMPSTLFHPPQLILFDYQPKGTELVLEFDVTLADSEYQTTALKRAPLLTWLKQKVKVISPEDLILHKLSAGRPLDIFDAKETCREQSGQLDLTYLRYWAKKLKLETALAKIVKK